MKQSKGFSLVELLVAMTVLSILMLSAIQIFASSIATHANVESVSRKFQKTEVGKALLDYELRLSGYRGVTANYASRTFSESPLQINSNNLKILYYEDRFVTTPTLQTVVYSITKAGLMRKVGTGKEALALAGVTKLITSNLITDKGVKTAPIAGIYPNVIAAEITLEFSDKSVITFIAPIVNEGSKVEYKSCSCPF
jgi:prepilin-type N-terminal cleavage/methylation domain-containing protein